MLILVAMIISIFKKAAGVIVAYAIFATSAVLLFKLAKQNPHAAASVGFQMATAAWGVFFSLIAGLVLQLISKTKTLTINCALAAVMAGFALFSLIKSEGSHWTQVQAMVLFAPASILGGSIYLRKKKN